MKGKVHFHEPGKGRWGTGISLVAGGLPGLIGGPVGLLAWTVAGGMTRGLIGKIWISADRPGTAGGHG